MAFFTILTSIGQAKIANAIALGQQIAVTEMALGDGNGNPTNPVQSQTALVREVYRAQLNQLSTDPANPNYVIAELVVPSEEGGWTVHEVGLYDEDDDLIAVGNFPATYKPELAEGASRDLVVRIIIEVSNASAIELKIDPSIVLASRQWVASQFLLRSKVAGGLTGQVLTKKSNTVEDFEWRNPGEAINVLVDVIPERQTLATDQTIVNWALINASGISVYIEGARLIETIDFIVTGAAQITLASSWPDGSIIHGYQNEALDQIAGATESARGLIELATSAEVTDGVDALRAVTPATLRAIMNFYAAVASPPGAVQAFARATPPLGWLRANGAAVSRTTYNALFAAIGTTFGAGDGSTTFTLPDLRGEFVRGLDDGRGVDAGRLIGTAQAAYAGENTYTVTTYDTQGGGNPTADALVVNGETIGASGTQTKTIATTPGDTRPRNIALLYCIKH